MHRILILIALFLMIISLPVDAKLNLNKAIPGGVDSGKDGESLYESYTPENALVNIRRVYSALDSFRKLTDISRSTMSKDELKQIGNTLGEVQNIGFDNWISGINGTVLKQEYQLMKLNYDLAEARFKLGEISKEELQKTKKEYEEGEMKFQKFWNKFQIVD